MNPVAVGSKLCDRSRIYEEHIRTLANLSKPRSVVIQMPDFLMRMVIIMKHQTSLAKKDEADFAAKGWLNIVGGCCGTTPDHIRAIIILQKELSHAIEKQNTRSPYGFWNRTLHI